ncbi:MAG TPA: hypothetical protein VG965_01500 [Patescibacteria group bacterium]|nr:hypothetical protein [Patescibacteria group bacterium]
MEREGPYEKFANEVSQNKRLQAKLGDRLQQYLELSAEYFLLLSNESPTNTASFAALRITALDMGFSDQQFQRMTRRVRRIYVQEMGNKTDGE